jgi:hypothetical protein
MKLRHFLLARPSARFDILFALTISALALGCEKPTEPAPPTEAVVQPAVAAPATPTAPVLPTPPAGARVFFIEPSDGAEVKGPLVDGKVPVKVKMGAEGIEVQAAGEQKQGAGHHHIIVDGEQVVMGTVVPKDDTHLHYGKGQSEADLMLAPGEHTLTLQFADGAHMSYGPTLSASMKLKIVGEPAAAPK